MKTRTVNAGSSDLHSNYLNNNEKVNVYIKKTGTTENVTGVPESPGYITYTSDGHYLTSDYTPEFPESGNIDITAVFPNTVTSTTNKFEVFTTQTGGDNSEYCQSDLMCAVASNYAKSSGTIALKFKHLLSKVIIKLKSGTSGVDVTNAKYLEISTPYTEVPIEYSQTEGWKLKPLPTPAPTSGSIILDMNGTAKYTNPGAAAIVIPQTIPAGNQLLYFQINDVDYEYYTEEEITFAPGCVHTLTFVINNNKVVASNHHISNWDSGTNYGEYNVEPQ